MTANSKTMTAVRFQGQADIRDCPEMSVPDPKQTLNVALTHPRTQCSNSCRLEPRSINSCDSNAPAAIRPRLMIGARRPASVDNSCGFQLGNRGLSLEVAFPLTKNNFG